MSVNRKVGSVAAVLIAVSMITSSFAAAPKSVVAVALSGEAGEAMKIVADKTKVKAGVLEFVVTNEAIGTDHEMVLVKLPSKDAQITANKSTQRIDEKKLESMGEVAGLKAGDKGKLKVKLAAGEYVLLCNHKAHYELGMATHLTVVN
jgi:uncharacterized cupredoxin-like copper-binding protein